MTINRSLESIWKGRSSAKGNDHLYYATKRQIENKITLIEKKQKVKFQHNVAY